MSRLMERFSGSTSLSVFWLHIGGSVNISWLRQRKHVKTFEMICHEVRLAFKQGCGKFVNKVSEAADMVGKTQYM